MQTERKNMTLREFYHNNKHRVENGFAYNFAPLIKKVSASGDRAGFVTIFTSDGLILFKVNTDLHTWGKSRRTGVPFASLGMAGFFTESELDDPFSDHGDQEIEILDIDGGGRVSLTYEKC
jgi:hypothetical protein